jgi:hypothetical protein
MKKIAILVAALTLLLPVPTFASVPQQKFKNCTAVNKVYEGGIAKNKKVSNKNSKGVAQKSKYAPFVSKKIYNQNKGMDRDKDGIACER